jgi:hypothetical protein
MAKNRDYDGRFAPPDDAPLSLTDGLRPMDTAELRRRSDLVVSFASRAGNPTPRTGLDALRVIRYHLERLELYAVANARSLGWSWGQIAETLGLSKQVVHRRYASRYPRLRRKYQRRLVAGG